MEYTWKVLILIYRILFSLHFSSNYKWLPKEIASQIITESLSRITSWLVPCSVGQNGLWGFCMTRQGTQQLLCLPLTLHPTILNSDLLNPSHAMLIFICQYSSAFSGAGPRWVQHHTQRPLMNLSMNSIDEEVLCIIGDTWTTFVSVLRVRDLSEDVTTALQEVKNRD